MKVRQPNAKQSRVPKPMTEKTSPRLRVETGLVPCSKPKLRKRKGGWKRYIEYETCATGNHAL